MEAWVNIVVSPDDTEIAAIDDFEGTLGELPEVVRSVRELITRFEACHFKARRHYRHILGSIEALRPMVPVSGIGAAHPRNGPGAVVRDATGRARAGQQYIEALKRWLGDPEPARPSDPSGPRVGERLGPRSAAKERLVRLLLARLLYRDLAEYSDGGDLATLEYQVMATDICCYAFPENLERVVRAIGRLEPLADFEGCGTISPEMDAFLETEFERLRGRLEHRVAASDGEADYRWQVQRWLLACLAKTVKEQGDLEDSMPPLGGA